MSDLMVIIISSLACLSTMIGTFLIYVKMKEQGRILAFSLGLAFIVMFLISIFDLIPEALCLMREIKMNNIFSKSLVCLLIGYLLVSITEKKIDNDNQLYKIGVLSMITLFIHNLPEGIITSITTYNNTKLGLKMSALIMLHNIPEGICIALPIYYATKSKFKAYKYTFISGLGEVIGAVLSILFLKKFITIKLLAIILMITSGIMITLSLDKILKEALSYKKYKDMCLGILLGIIIIILTL